MAEFGIVNAVARAISKAIEEAIEERTQWVETPEGDLLHGPGGAIHLLGDDGEMKNAANGLTSEFTIVLSDGQEFAVRVTPKHG